MQYKTLTHKIIGCAMKVHNALHSGFQEVIYQRALAIEMTNQQLRYQREQEMPIFYDGRAIGTRRVDFFVEYTIMVEIKAVAYLEDVHLAQSMNYCQALAIGEGLIVAATYNGVYVSRDLGRTWTAENWSLTNYQVLSVAIGKEKIAIGVEGDGVFTSPFPTLP